MTSSSPAQPPTDQNASSGRSDHGGNGTPSETTKPVEVVEGTPAQEPDDRKPHLNQ